MKLPALNSNSLIARMFSFIFDMLTLSICWFLCALPIVTMGLSSTGLFYSCNKMTIEKKDNPLKLFATSVKKNLKQAITVNIILLVFTLLIAWSMWISYQVMNNGNPVGRIVFFSGLVIVFLFIGYVAYIFPTLALYEYKTKELFGICFKLSLAHLPITLLFSIIYVLFILSVYYFWPVLFIFPGLIGIIKAKLLDYVYSKHTNEENSEIEEDNKTENK